MIKVVLLDIDNTLLDFDAYISTSLKEGFERFGLGYFDEGRMEIFKTENRRIWHELELGKLTYGELLKTRFNRIFALMGVDFDGEVFEKHFKDRLYDCAIPVDGAFELLEHLKGRYTLCVASNGPVGQQINRLKISGMLDYFKHLFISEGIGTQKPSAGFFDHCMREINAARATEGADPLEKDEVMMVGDSLSSDIKGACGYGIPCIFYDRSGKGDTKGLCPDYTVKNLTDICDIL